MSLKKGNSLLITHLPEQSILIGQKIQLYKLRYNWVNYCFEVHDLEIGKKALLKSIEQGIDYRNFKYTKTYCKRCAAIEDGIVPEYALCSQCNENYHDSSYDMCYNCFDLEKS